ncbi:MAG: hypothetical protein ACYYK0_07985, partial [Candidatus Eutrophobiaceae bacterium]
LCSKPIQYIAPLFAMSYNHGLGKFQLTRDFLLAQGRADLHQWRKPLNERGDKKSLIYPRMNKLDLP